jgi:uncharacterized protein YicC (UPF0701 family)
MTGYGYAKKETRRYGSFEIEVISLNSKTLEISLTGNRDILGLEKEIRKLVRKYLKKGKVKIKFYFPPPEDYHIDEKKIGRLIHSFKKFTKDKKINIYFDNADVIREIIIKREEQTEKKKIFIKLLEKAIKNLLNFRKREGKNLKKAVMKEVKKLKSLTRHIDEEKCKEEKIRLLSHLKAIQRIIHHPTGPCGKELDFLGQEILREGNTISQKAETLQGVKVALAIKVCAEAIREISRNIE